MRLVELIQKGRCGGSFLCLKLLRGEVLLLRGRDALASGLAGGQVVALGAAEPDKELVAP